MKKVTFINSRGESVELYREPLFLTNIEGLGDVSAEIQSQKVPGQDGSDLIDVRLEERFISMEVDIISDFTANRQLLSKIFNPKLGAGTLIYENSLIKYRIKAVAEHVPQFPDNRPIVTQKAFIDLKCPSPYWEDMNSGNYKLEDFVSNFRFPFHFPVRFSTRGDSRVLVNEGSVPTPILVEFRGPVTNPKITNQTTGEFIKVNREIPEGFKLILDTSFGNKRVEIVAPDGVIENAFHYIDLQSTFFDLQIGDNKISFITEGGNPEVYVDYKNRHVGV